MTNLAKNNGTLLAADDSGHLIKFISTWYHATLEFDPEPFSLSTPYFGLEEGINCTLNLGIYISPGNSFVKNTNFQTGQGDWESAGISSILSADSTIRNINTQMMNFHIGVINDNPVSNATLKIFANLVKWEKSLITPTLKLKIFKLKNNRPNESFGESWGEYANISIDNLQWLIGPYYSYYGSGDIREYFVAQTNPAYLGGDGYSYYPITFDPPLC